MMWGWLLRNRNQINYAVGVEATFHSFSLLLLFLPIPPSPLLSSLPPSFFLSLSFSLFTFKGLLGFWSDNVRQNYIISSIPLPGERGEGGQGGRAGREEIRRREGGGEEGGKGGKERQ